MNRCGKKSMHLKMPVKTGLRLALCGAVGLFMFAMTGFAGSAHAACSDPVGYPGDQIYNSTHRVMQYCNAADKWIPMWGASVGSGGGGGSSLSDCEANGGAIVGGACWYLGVLDQTCTSVCAGHNGYNAATLSYAGSGGTNDNCKEVLDVLTGDVRPLTGTQAAWALGCVVASNGTTRYRGLTATTEAANGAAYRRACACNRDITAGSGGGGGGGTSSGGGCFTISAGADSSCAIDGAGKAYCWGKGEYGKLGNGTVSNHAVPKTVANGTSPGTFKKIATGVNHSCVIGTDDKAYCWGDGRYGENGDTTVTERRTPVTVVNGDSPGTFKSIQVGDNHTCGLGTDDKIYCWGGNADGQLGDDTTSQRNAPRATVNGAGPGTYKWLSVGEKSLITCAIGTDDKAYCWGDGQYGQLGNGTTGDRDVPTLVSNGASPGTFKMISAGTNHVCALGTDDKAYCWGHGGSGENGDNTTNQRSTPVLALNGAGPGTYKRIEAGDNHTCGLGTDDKIYCWGMNSSGQLGDSTVAQRNTPVLALNDAGPGTYTSVQVGAFHTCATGTDQKVYCWGENGDRQLGDNTTVDKRVPTLVLNGESGGTFAGCEVSGGGGGGGGGPTDGFLVLTNGTWNGNLGGRAGADAKCLADLQANNWLGKGNAALTAGNVKALICDSTTCNTAMPHTEYSYARSGSATDGGGSFTTNGSSVGTNDTTDWGLFGINSDFWTNLGSSSASTWVNSPDSSDSCNNWASSSSGYRGGHGNTYHADRYRWKAGTRTCQNTMRLMCIVDPTGGSGGGGGGNQNTPEGRCANAGGDFVGSACWFLSAAGESCADACDDAYGIYDEATLTFAGSDAGASNANCQSVLDALSAPGTGVPTTQANTYGCHVNGTTRRRGTNATTENAMLAGVRRACACKVGGDDMGNHTATENINMNNNRIVNLADPTNPTDIATQGYVDSRTGGNEIDPQVGTLLADKWCVVAGSVMNCDQDNPIGSDQQEPIAVLATLEKPKGVSGGTPGASGSWHTYPLSTLRQNSAGAFLKDQGIELPAGIYSIDASATFNNLGTVSMRLFSGGTSLVDGLSAKMGTNAQITAYLRGIFTLSAPTIVTLQYRHTGTPGANGLGIAMDEGTETYGTVYIESLTATEPPPVVMANCSLDGQEVLHGNAHLFYNTQTHANCASQSESRMCTDGVLDGTPSFQYANCNAPGDTTPNAFTFTDLTAQALSTVVSSNIITITGIDTPTAVTVSGSGSPMFNINGTGWVSSGNITNNQTLQVRATTASTGATGRNITVNVGGVTDTWTISTACNIQTVGGYKWVAGNSTCDAACSVCGGTCNLAATRDYAGSGGSNGRCENVLSALGMSASVTDATAESGGGCSYVFGFGVRITSPTTTCFDSGGGVTTRVCACNGL